MVGEGGGDPKFQLGEVFLGGDPPNPPLKLPPTGTDPAHFGGAPLPPPQKNDALNTPKNLGEAPQKKWGAGNV